MAKETDGTKLGFEREMRHASGALRKQPKEAAEPDRGIGANPEGIGYGG